MYLVIGPIIDEPKIEFLYAAIFVVGGLLLYVPFVYFHLKIPGMGKFESMVFSNLLKLQ